MPQRFTIVVPVYQNEMNIDDTVEKLLSLQDRIDLELDLLFVEDGSTDGSREKLIAHRERHPDRIGLVLLTRNFGQTPAILAGLKHANGDCVGVISCDLQEPYEKFVDMLDAWRGGAKFVVGERVSRHEGTLHRAVSGTYWGLVRRHALRDFPRGGYDFCLLDRSVLHYVAEMGESHTSVFPLLWWLGYQAHRVPIVRQARTAGKSQWTWWMKLGFTIDTVISFTHIPARIVSTLGMLGSAGFLAATVYLGVNWFVKQSAPPGWMSVVAMLGLVASALLFSIGLVIEYLVRILDEVRGRPTFVVEKVVTRDVQVDQR